MIINILLWMMWYCIVSNGAISYWIAWDSEAIFQIMHRKIIDRKAWYNNMIEHIDTMLYWLVYEDIVEYYTISYNTIRCDFVSTDLTFFRIIRYYTNYGLHYRSISGYMDPCYVISTELVPYHIISYFNIWLAFIHQTRNNNVRYLSARDIGGLFQIWFSLHVFLSHLAL